MNQAWEGGYSLHLVPGYLVLIPAPIGVFYRLLEMISLLLVRIMVARYPLRRKKGSLASVLSLVASRLALACVSYGAPDLTVQKIHGQM